MVLAYAFRSLLVVVAVVAITSFGPRAQAVNCLFCSCKVLEAWATIGANAAETTDNSRGLRHDPNGAYVALESARGGIRSQACSVNNFPYSTGLFYRVYNYRNISLSCDTAAQGQEIQVTFSDSGVYLEKKWDKFVCNGS